MKFSLLVLLFCIINAGYSDLFAQAMVEDGKMTVTPNWSRGDAISYEYESYRYFKDGKDEKTNDTNFFQIDLKVAEVNADNYLIEAKYLMKDTTTETYRDKFYRDVYHNTRMFYKIKDNGEFEDLASMNMLISVVRYAMEKNWQMFNENPDMQRKVTKDEASHNINQIFTHGEQFVRGQMRIGELFMYLHGFYGESYNMEDTTMQIDSLENPFTKESHNVVSIAKINKLDAAENIIDVTITTRTNETEGFLAGMDFYLALGENFKDQKDVPKTKIEFSARYIVDLASGWVKFMEYTSEYESKDAKMISKRTMKQIE